MSGPGGWHAPSLLSVAEAEALAADAGLARAAAEDLSSLQRLGRPRDRLIRVALPLLRRHRRRSMWAQSLVGGHALHCHRAGVLQYRMLRFERGTTSRGAERRDPAVGRIATRRRRND